MTALLALDDVSVVYGKQRALEGIALSVEAGEVVTLLGANGSGKSTTLRAISGLVRPVRGRILYEGRDITAWPSDAIVAAGISQVPEGREIFPDFTVLDNLLVGGHTARGRDVAERLERAFTTLPLLRERRRQRAGTLSGGEQQMLAIARALMAGPRLLLLDEPSLGLAPMVTREIFRVIQRINAAGVTVLLVEQNARRALALARRAYVLETGRVVVSGARAASWLPTPASAPPTSGSRRTTAVSSLELLETPERGLTAARGRTRDGVRGPPPGSSVRSKPSARPASMAEGNSMTATCRNHECGPEGDRPWPPSSQ